MTNCSLCGLDEPHYHSADDVQRERVVRPAFESALRDLFDLRRGQLYRLWQIGGSWMSRTPTQDYRCYPVVFGWHGARDQYETEPYGADHWAYRRGCDAPYFNQGVEFAWQLWRAAVSSTLKSEIR